LNPKFSLERRLAYRFSILSTINASVCTRKLGLTTATWRILSIIGRYEPIFAGVAAQRSTMDADKVTRAVDKLVEIGYVIRNTDAADRRRVILCLTSKGRTVYEQVEELSQLVDAKWRSVLTDEENLTLDTLMDKLDARAQQMFVEAAPADLLSDSRQPSGQAKEPAARPLAAKKSRVAGRQKRN
jgi:DNA-binding MarR family transcriptional regulator